MLKANFKITETGGTGIVQLQSSADTGATWHDIGALLTLNQGTFVVDDTTDVEIDTSVFIPGETYRFRLADASGSPVSSEHTFTIPSITDYVSAHDMIGFINTSGDSWQVSFHATPISAQQDSGVTISSYDYVIYFNVGGISTPLDNGTISADYTTICGGSGAGVYDLVCKYNFSNGLAAYIKRLVKVDGAGNILADIQFNGTRVSAVDGLTIHETAYITQVGVNYDISWLAADANAGNPVEVGTGITADLTLPTGTAAVLCIVNTVEDHVFDDYHGDPLMGHTLIIS